MMRILYGLPKDIFLFRGPLYLYGHIKTYYWKGPFLRDFILRVGGVGGREGKEGREEGIERGEETPFVYKTIF
jgi:hypothetical protein